MLNVQEVKQAISAIPYIKSVTYQEEDKVLVCGKIEVELDGLEKPLEFEFKIHPQYPLKSYHSESIKFFNKKMLEYSHVMIDGSICIHTSYKTNIPEKIRDDFSSLRHWIEKYYLNHEKDKKYEHILVRPQAINNKYYFYLFTNIDYEFKCGEYGEMELSHLNESSRESVIDVTYIVQKFLLDENNKVECDWNQSCKHYPERTIGFFIFIEQPPAKYNKFVFQDFEHLEAFIPHPFLEKLFQFEQENIKHHKGKLIPIFIGYYTAKPKIHWQVLMLEIGKFPIITDGYAEKNGLLLPLRKIKKQTINWAVTHNASYENVFGRGTLDRKITNSKILIIGIGAIGSTLAKALVKGGCRYIAIADYELKEPGNVCRSEYSFHTGITEKVFELEQILLQNSPFVEIAIFEKKAFDEMIKMLYTHSEIIEGYRQRLNEFDIIFDCTTDNDLMYVLDSLQLSCDLINLSITNYAKDLVCAFAPNIYHFVNTQFESILENRTDDLYEPFGCGILHSKPRILT
ncbi:MAG: ThiF family adenylyltransferase [Spirochaetota bacterium]